MFDGTLEGRDIFNTVPELFSGFVRILRPTKSNCVYEKIMWNNINQLLTHLCPKN